MKDPNLLLSILSIVWVITVGLFIYIIKIKDKGEDSTRNSLNEIKTMLNGMNLSISKIQSDLENNIYVTREMNKKVDSHNNLIQQLQLKITTLTGKYAQLEQRHIIVEKRLNSLK